MKTMKMMILRSRPIIHWLIGVCVTGQLIAMYGCASKQHVRPATPRSSATAQNKAQNKADSSKAAPFTIHSGGVTQSIEVLAGVLPLGAVPFDNMTLPLISPDGRFVATQAGVPPTWSTMMASEGAEMPLATRVEIYQLDRRDNINPDDRQQPALIAKVNDVALIGRSCDRQGFLIESPREDGSRWIGKASWDSGKVEWLVQGEDVNAFAALGPDGRLAWSRRARSDKHFSLAIRHGADEFTIPADEEDWLTPTWSGRDDGLFVINLATNGTLEARHVSASDAAAFAQSMRHFTIINDATMFTALQTLPGQIDLVDGRTPERDQLVLFHAGLNRVAIWRPLAPPTKKAIRMNSQSVAALVDEEDFALVCTGDNLLRQSLSHANERIDLVAGMQIPRMTNLSQWPFVLLNPIEGRVRIMAMRLMPRQELKAASASK